MISPLPPEIAADLTSVADIVRAAWARGLEPDTERTVDAWADEKRKVAAESGSPFPGQWITDRVPFGRAIMQAMSLSHPCRRVTVAKSAQTSGSECGLNLLGQIMAETPCAVLVMLPTVKEGADYNRLKLQPMIDATPAVAARVRRVVSRDETGSTTTFKAFRGGYLQIVGANSSANLQMRTARVLLNEEISEFPFDVDGRGDPLLLAEERLQGNTGREKIIDISTPALEGTCRVTKLYARSSRGRYMVPCPHCHIGQALEFKNLRWKLGDDPAEHSAEYACASCGVLIAGHHKPAMIAAGTWVHERPELLELHVGFHINALYSPFLTWLDVAKKYETARDAGSLKVFTQQQLGLPFKEEGEAPDHARLHATRERDRPLKQIPPQALWITGAADVQGDRIEWDVYAWGPGLTAWLIDTGIIIGQPTDEAPWRQLSEVADRRYTDARGRTWPIDAFGCDSGYQSQAVYRWASADPAPTGRRFALDGRGGLTLPALGTPKKIDIDWEGQKVGAILLWPVGTHSLKLDHYAAIRRTVKPLAADGSVPRGLLHLPGVVDEEYCRQLTAEFFHQPAKGKSEWRVITGTRNERLDTAVYARALAHHLTDHLTPVQWQSVAAARAIDLAASQADLSAYWSDRFGTSERRPVPAPAAPAVETSLPQPVMPPPARIVLQPRSYW
ncbi:phage terminase large subunit family protein [Sandarakinorhabdus sp.]|uniref:phage terminase large subunit family protein n=1 Tax=Sandarakinorhabdus sp. TaxID=1916663 RepID=UPI0035615D2B